MIGKYSTIMSQRVNVVPEEWNGHEGLRRPKPEELEQMMDSALKFCTTRSSKSPEEIIRLISSSHLWANSTLRYALAREIQKMLSADPKFRDLFIYGSVMEDRARLTSNINLLLHVKDSRQDFESWCVLVDEGLRKLFRVHFAVGEGFRTLIDYHVVTDEDVSRKAGYANMLTSTNPPITRLV